MTPTARPRVVIAAAADDRYALPLAVMLRSAADALGPQAKIEAHIVDDGMSVEAREKVEASVPARVALHWIPRTSSAFTELPRWGRMSLTTYHKLTLGEWLPAEAEKALWLDCDTLVLADLVPLWEKEFENHILLAVQDVIVPRVSSSFGIAAYRELGLAPETAYFNAGVMLIDLTKWRRENIGPQAVDYLRRFHGSVFFWDQEALNAVLATRWKKLEPHWNWNPVVDRLTNGRSRTETNPAIIHFSGNLKPWTYHGTGPDHARFYECLDQTEWRGWRPERSWRGWALAAYDSSRLRAFLYPLEQIHLRLVRWMTRR